MSADVRPIAAGRHLVDCQCSRCNLARADAIVAGLPDPGPLSVLDTHPSHRHWYSTRQRLVVVTFPTPAYALYFDRDPYSDTLTGLGAELAIVGEP